MEIKKLFLIVLSASLLHLAWFVARGLSRSAGFAPRDSEDAFPMPNPPIRGADESKARTAPAEGLDPTSTSRFGGGQV